MSAQDKQMDGDTGPETQENDLVLREQWTRRWASLEDCVGIDENIAYRCERDARLAIICHETLVFVRPRKPSRLPRRNSIHVRERGTFSFSREFVIPHLSCIPYLLQQAAIYADMNTFSRSNDQRILFFLEACIRSDRARDGPF